MNPGKFLRFGVPGYLQPGRAEFCAQVDQALGDCAKVIRQGQRDVEQHGGEHLVNSFGSRL